MKTSNVVRLLFFLLWIGGDLFSQDWMQIGNDIDGRATNDRSGQAIALSSDGNILAIGAPQHDLTRNGTVRARNAGQVRVFQNVDGNWTQIGRDIFGAATDDILGVAVALSSDGNILAIGATGHDGAIGSNVGHVRIFQNISGNWSPMGEIEGEAAGDRSGEGVALSSDGKILAIGARLNDNNNGNDAGHVRVFENVFWKFPPFNYMYLDFV